MDKKESSSLSRRNFISYTPLLVFGGSLITSIGASLMERQDTRKFWEEPTPEEQKIIDRSIMANDMEN